MRRASPTIAVVAPTDDDEPIFGGALLWLRPQS
jgi:hypothetical protein